MHAILAIGVWGWLGIWILLSIATTAFLCALMSMNSVRDRPTVFGPSCWTEEDELDYLENNPPRNI